ncbi:hypothetical protein RJ639_023483 [Escallonia herrerae]|uniref:Retrovirus-related Pol polyprotein from transposon TNT 1-94 n=1 Tax=Escallonia herrerae TaxID=1293975 RepID=A0AA88UZ31_9ASTE|nr:hypothetical protein RJ639_023483 [Escallonia herrerae]
MNYPEFFYSGKGNVSRIYDVCRAFYRPKKETKTLTDFFMDFKKTYEELNVLLPFSSDIKVQQAQREQMADLITKQTICKGHVYDGLYILDAWVPRSVACSGVVSPFEAHCRLGHPSLPVLKKLCPQFHDVSSVDFFNGDVPYSVLFLTKTLFPVEPRIFGSTCFVRDVRPHLTKLDPKALKCVFLGYSRLQKGHRCYCPDLHRYLVSTDVVFSEHSPFFSSKSDSSSKGEDDDWLMYKIFPSVPTEPAISEDRTLADGLSVPVSVPVKPSNAIDGASSGVAQSEDVNCLGEQAILTSTPVKPPIVQVYSRRQEHHDTCPKPASSSSDPPPTDLDLPIGLRKGKRHCTLPKYLIANFISYDHLSSSSSSFIVYLNSVSIPKTVKEALSHPGWHNAMLEEIQALDDNHTWDLVNLPEGKKAVGCKWVNTVKFNADGSMARLKARLVAKGFAQTYGVDYSDTFSPVAKLTSVRLFISLAASLNWSLHQLDIKNAFLHGDLVEEVYMEQPPGFVAQEEYGKEMIAQESLLSRNSYRPSFIQKTGQLKYFLGIEETRSKKGIFLSQRKYVLDLLAETRTAGAKPCNTPMNPSVHLTKDDVSTVSQFMSEPTVKHWAALKLILCYLKGAPGLGLLYSNHGHSCIECFSDVDWAGSKLDRKSTTGYCVFVGGNLVSWKSKKQSVVSRSSAESKYRAMAQSTCEIMWICHLLEEISLKPPLPAKLWCDNQAARYIASNPVYYERTKHIEVDCHFIREKIQEN